MKDVDRIIVTSPKKSETARHRPRISARFYCVAAFALCGLLVLGIRVPNITHSFRYAFFPLVRADDSVEAGSEELIVSNGVYLPSERLRERQFDQARRLIDGGRMADATALLDEMLTAEQDVFLEGDSASEQTRRSMKTMVTELIGELPESGSKAYQLQFRTRATRDLQKALNENDNEAIIAVARRWFHTEAGHRSAILTAARLLESGQPLAAEAWLERIANSPRTNLPDTLLPTFKLMQAATTIAIDPHDKTKAQQLLEEIKGSTRLGGELVPERNLQRDQLLISKLIGATSGPNTDLTLASENWAMSRGRPNRNPIRPCDRPLLVPRFRVPLTLHPQEQRLLTQRSELLAEQGLPIFPAGTPLAVGNSLLVQSRAGVMAIDFESGKRTWIEGRLADSAIADSAPNEFEEQGTHPLDKLFYDSTSSTLSSDGELVFVVEQDVLRISRERLRQPGRSRPIENSNRLVAYDIAQEGKLRWQLPRVNEQPTSRWFLGSPLPLGKELYVLVEERQQIRLDVLSSATGDTLWSQPLAEIDVEYDINNRNDRKQLGLSPAFAEGTLVCPTGAGAAIAVDLAARTLRWAYRFNVPKPDDVRRLANGIRLRMPGFAGGMAGMQIKATGENNTSGGKWLDALPTISGNKVILTPAGSEFLHCVNIRTGEAIWQSPRTHFVNVAGIVDRMVIVLGQKEVAAVSLDDGKIIWKQGIGLNDEIICGRGILSNNRLYVPTNAPAVAEINLSTGKLVATSLGRGSAPPGNLVSYRGEVISQGLDFLDVYHQTADLERNIETALKQDSMDLWALHWRGELNLSKGNTSEGLNDIRRVHGPAGPKPSASTVSQAIEFALKNDFAGAAASWSEGAKLAPSQHMAASIRRLAVDGFLEARKPMKAWDVCRDYLQLASLETPPENEDLIHDREDSSLWIGSSRWFQRKLKQILQSHESAPKGSTTKTLRQKIDQEEKLALNKAARISDLETRRVALETFIDRFGNRPMKETATGILKETLRAELAGRTGVARQDILLQLQMLALNDIDHSQSGQNPLEQTISSENFVRDAWPIGKVDVTQSQETSAAGDILNKSTHINLVHAQNSGFPGATLEHTGRSIILRDKFGTPIGDAISIEIEGAKHPHLTSYFRLRSTSAFLIDRILLLQNSHSLTAFEVCEPTDGEHRLLWAKTNDSLVQPRQPLTTRTPTGTMERLLRPLGPLPLQSKVAVELSNHQIQRIPTFRIGRPHQTGVPIISGKSLELCDIRTGNVLWRRRNIPPRTEIFGDDEVLCITSRDGKNSQILSMTDGHKIASHDLPARQNRLAIAGRNLLVVQPTNSDTDETLQLAVVDITDKSHRAICECPATTRGVITEDNIFIAITTDGQLTAIDVANGQTKFVTMLEEMPTGFRELRCLPWQDRYIVFASRNTTMGDEKRFQGIDAVERFGVGSGLEKADSSTVWSLSKLTGDMMWSRPASIQRHIIQSPQPAGLPTLIFGRRLRMANTSAGQGRGRYRLSVLCIDKRNGAMLYLDDKLQLESPQTANTAELKITADAVTSSVEMRIISRRQMGGDIPKITLHFTGFSSDDTEPFRAEQEPLVYTDVLSELKYWIERAIIGQ
jgi:outer membrane protein assembly factor BamB